MFERIRKFFKKKFDKQNRRPKKIPREQLTDEFLRELMKINGKVYLDDFTNKAIAKELGFKMQYPIRMTLRGDKTEHTIKF